MGARAQGFLRAPWELSCALADKIQPYEKRIAKGFSRSKLIVDHVLRQANFSRCSTRFVFLVRESPHLEPIFVSQDDVACNSELCHPAEFAQRSPRFWLRSFSCGASVHRFLQDFVLIAVDHSHCFHRSHFT